MANQSNIYIFEKEKETEMKFNSRMCVKCGGSKQIGNSRSAESAIFGSGVFIECPNCNGEGIEYIISPKQLKEYQKLKKKRR